MVSKGLCLPYSFLLQDFSQLGRAGSSLEAFLMGRGGKYHHGDPRSNPAQSSGVGAKEGGSFTLFSSLAPLHLAACERSSTSLPPKEKIAGENKKKLKVSLLPVDLASIESSVPQGQDVPAWGCSQLLCDSTCCYSRALLLRPHRPELWVSVPGGAMAGDVGCEALPTWLCSGLKVGAYCPASIHP